MVKTNMKLPKTTSYWMEEGVLFIKHTSFMITLEENKAITDLIASAMIDNTVKGIVINNREANGAWPKEIVEASAADNTFDKINHSKKIATLTNSIITTMQMNRHSRVAGIEEWAKAFNSDFNEEVKMFLFG